MAEREFGRGGPRVPIIGQGTWGIDAGPRDQAVAALRAGLDAGLTHIDTAEMYGGAEAIVGEAIAGRRDAVFLVSKVVPDHATRAGVVKACEASLGRLGTDRLDCYLLHWPGRHPLAETIAGFEDLKAAGKILAWGVSNCDVAELDEALRIAGPGVIACNQVLYHLGQRAIEHAVIPWCRANGVAVVGYSPFGSGSFPRPATTGGRVLAKVAARHRTTPHAVALAFLTRLEGVFTIPKTARADRAVENAAGAALVLDRDDLMAIDAAFPRGTQPRSLPML
ncbi:aldo/keto reductase [Methylobacterium sp. Leaf108]|uniref:aldo/keto reductase n=1 Tax=Methylobacterium sp. Leaf108 TaxID=1736256 RepID=UPI0006F28EFD|nr:aldo/keto reductase [Methylobacterium sp. Leaf108]KQP61398.1 oxidoreductase [Methylobacterium sp. Leaf108]